MVFHLLYVIYIFHDFLFSFVLLETPFAALTGTADADTCSVIISTLCLKDPLMVHVSPNRNNLRFAITRTKKDAMFAELDWLVHHIKEKGELTDKTIVFCNTMNDIACVVNYLMMKLEKHAYSPKELVSNPTALSGFIIQVLGHIARTELCSLSEERGKYGL